MYGQRRSTQQQNDEEAEKGQLAPQDQHLGPPQSTHHICGTSWQAQKQVMYNADTSIPHLRHKLSELRAGVLSISAFSSEARSQQVLLQALPARYSEVWLGLLDRLESSALFSEESCSFSQSELLDSLSMWLDKAEQQRRTRV